MAKTIIIPKGENKAFDQFIEILREFHKENDLVISSHFGTSTAHAPSKKDNCYRSFAFRLAPNLFVNDGHSDFFNPSKYRSIGLFFFPENKINIEDD